MVNGATVKFYGFADTDKDGIQYSPGTIVSTPAYMLVKVDDRLNVAIPGLPPSVLPIKPVSFTRKVNDHKYAKLRQFPVTLAYAITDFKCQGQTFDFVLCDLDKPRDSRAPPTSAYIQLSRARSLQCVSIMRPFDIDQLSAPLPPELLDELRWQSDLAQQTRAAYM